jgi:L-ascorbate metabolism protein UlaG (beta-lactamase superfamily)
MLVGACSMRPAAVPPRAVETLTYLGVAGWRLDSSEGTLLVDPYFSRPAVEGDELLEPDQPMIDRHAPKRADVILVSHSHYDHVLDVPSIARRTGAVVVGTESTVRVARAGGVPAARLTLARAGDQLGIGPFQVGVVAGLHSLTGQPNEPIAEEIQLPAPARAYGEGGTLQYLVRVGSRAIFFVSSANFAERDVASVRADVAVIATGLRERVPDYTCRLLRALGKPPLVLPTHFDSFREPVRPLDASLPPNIQRDLDAFAAEIEACAPGTRFRIPVPMRPIEL